MLNLKVQQQHIRFPSGLEVEMSEKVKNLAQQAFSLFTGIHGMGSSSNSSSSTSLQQPSLGSSYEMVDPRSTQGRHSSSASRSSAARSQAYSADIQSSPTPHSMIMNSRDHRHSMPPPPSYMNMQQQQPQMSPHNFMQNTMNIGMQSQHSTHQPFPVDMTNNIAAFGTNQFQDSTLNSNSEEWYGVGFDAGATNFNGNSTAASFVALSSGQINQTMIGPQDTQSMPRWPQMPGTRRPHFDGQPQ
ncbi:hypothetical protein DL98DRAFT_42848 [Cadophora sp. DSE1049]|nr:hypothetical protein DL98DRAFT_42848 [Cadophora sp. DSE1049]